MLIVLLQHGETVQSEAVKPPVDTETSVSVIISCVQNFLSLLLFKLPQARMLPIPEGDRTGNQSSPTPMVALDQVVRNALKRGFRAGILVSSSGDPSTSTSQEFGPNHARNVWKRAKRKANKSALKAQRSVQDGAMR